MFAGIYFKLGDLLSMFSLHDDGARGMGRYIMHRPRMFLHHQLHRLNRTKRAATVQAKQDASRPAVQGVTPKAPEMKNQVSKPANKRAMQHKQPVTMRNKPDGMGRIPVRRAASRMGGGGR